MGILPLLLCSALMTLDDDRVGSTRQGSLLVCPPVGVGDVVDGSRLQNRPTEVGAETELFLVHDHPEIAISLLIGLNGSVRAF